MSSLVELELAAVDWSTLRAAAGLDARTVPEKVASLVASASEEEAQQAYWRLDNFVVVQGQLFEVAQHLVPVLLAALAGPLSSAAREAIADLLVEISCGESDQSELAIGNDGLGQACRAAVGEGIWLIHGLLLEQDPCTRRWAVIIIQAADPNRDRALRTISHFAREDPDESVRKDAQLALEEMA